MVDGDQKLVRTNAVSHNKPVHTPSVRQKQTPPVQQHQQDDALVQLITTYAGTDDTSGDDATHAAAVVKKKKPAAVKRAPSDEPDDTTDAENAAKKAKKESKNEQAHVEWEPPQRSYHELLGDKMVVRYPSDDVRNAGAVEAIFRQSLSDIQGADLQKVWLPDHAAYKDKIQLKLESVKLSVRMMMDSSDGERKWNTVGYGQVRLGVEPGTYGMLAPKLSERDYFVARNFQDHPATIMPNGTETIPIHLPLSMFQFKPTGPVMPTVSASARGKKMKKE